MANGYDPNYPYNYDGMDNEYEDLEGMQFDDDFDYQPPGRRRGYYLPRRGIPPYRVPGFPSRGFPDGPTQGPSRGEMPQGPPPDIVPRRDSRSSRLYAVDPGAIYNCRYKYTYIWLENGRSFWAWLTYVGRRSVAGYRWIGFRWVYFGTDLNNISDFICY